LDRRHSRLCHTCKKTPNLKLFFTQKNNKNSREKSEEKQDKRENHGKIDTVVKLKWLRMQYTAKKNEKSCAQFTI
jgi:hypothetical protein